MKIQLLPSTFNEKGCATAHQHLACFVLDDLVAIDAGSLAYAVSDVQRQDIRDIVITHPHLDHIASLPIFIDDLFSNLTSPVRVHATEETIEIIEEHIFNWKIFPRFSELTNEHGAVMEYVPFGLNQKFKVAHLEITAVAVNHQVSTVGLIISNGETRFAMTSDTAETEQFWEALNQLKNIDAVFIECAFPNALAELALASQHLTPKTLASDLAKLKHHCPVYAVNLKPMYRNEIIAELEALNLPNLNVMLPAYAYQF